MGYRTTLLIGVSVLVVQPCSAQQPDSSFRFDSTAPTYAAGTGPVVCIDEAHHNLHTATGTYAPFATLAGDDGYRVQSLGPEWSSTALRTCRVLVIANAIAQTNVTSRAFPHEPAFARAELDTMVAWIDDGGGLLLIADHAPFPGAVSDLGLILGVDMLDAFAGPGDSGAVIAVFGAPTVPDSVWQRYASDRGLPYRPIAGALANLGSLGSHPILQGRAGDPPVRWVVTFTGHPFYPSNRVTPLLTFGPHAIAALNRRNSPVFSAGGWLQAGALAFGNGRAVILGEASMCTAQVGGPRHIRTGMNVPEAPDNAQFCLNVVRWLAKDLD